MDANSGQTHLKEMDKMAAQEADPATGLAYNKNLSSIISVT